MTPQLKVPDVFLFSRTCIEWTNVQLMVQRSSLNDSRPGNTAVHPDKLRFWTANQQSAQQKAPVASQPHCFVTLEIKTSDSRGCNTPQPRNMWHRRICPQPMTFLRSWRTLRRNCRIQSSRDRTARPQSAPLHPLWKPDGDGSRCVTPDGSRWGDSIICRRGSPDWTSVRDWQKIRKCQISWKNSVT